MKKLDAEELEILDAFDAGSLLPVSDMKAEIRRHREAATATFAKDSRIRLIGVTSGTTAGGLPKRSKYLPDVPTIAESGLPGYQFDSWFGLLGPVGTPAAEVTRVNAAMATLLKDPAVLTRLDKQGIEPMAMNNADFAKLLAIDYERMAKVVKASGAKVE